MAWAGPGYLLGLFFGTGSRRWGTLLGAQRDAGPFGIRQSAVFIGFAGNCLPPAHAGELIRAALLRRLANVPLGAALSSILASRLLDAIPVFLFLVTPLILGSSIQTGHRTLNTLQLGWLGLVLAILYRSVCVATQSAEIIVRWAGAASRMLGLGRFSQRLAASLSDFLPGLDALRSPGRTVIAMLETCWMWGLIAITYWAGMLAFGISSPGLTGSLFVTGVAALNIALPLSPGYFGPFEAAIGLALGFYAIQLERIVAYAITLHLLMVISLLGVA